MRLVNKILKPVLFFLFSCCINTIVAQKRAYNFEKLNTTHGLSSNRITSILQDRDGFYWIATEDGLNRFDGTSFRVYRNIKNNYQTLIHNFCTSLQEADNGDIWIGTYNGISVFRKRSEKFENYLLKIAGADLSLLNRVTAVAKDKKGTIWVSSRGLWKYDSLYKKFQAVPLNLSADKNEKNLEIFHLQYDSVLNGLWFRTWATIHFYDISANTLYDWYKNEKKWKIFDHLHASPIALDDKHRLWFYDDSIGALCAYSISENKIETTKVKILNGLRKIECDRDEKVWLSFGIGKAVTYDIKTKKVDSSFFEFVHPLSAAANDFSDLFIDNNSFYWIGSSGGISILKPSQQFYEIFPMGENIQTEESSDFAILAVAEKNESSLYVGTTQGLYSYSLNTRKYGRLKISGLPDRVRCLHYSQPEKKLWIGGMEEVVVYDEIKNRIIKRIPVKPFPCFIIPHSESIWIGTWHNGLYRTNNNGEILGYYSDKSSGKYFLRKNTLIAGFVYDENLWVGYNGGNGFAVFNKKDSLFNDFNIQKGSGVISEVGTVTAMAGDNYGNLWIGSFGGGIYFWNRKENSFVQYLQSDGLRSDFIYNIIRDKKNNLWICHSNGVDYFLTEKNKFIPLPFELNFAGNDYHNSVYTGENDNLFFFNAHTIIQVRSPWNQNRDFFAKPVISGFKIFGKDIPVDSIKSGIRLTYRQNFFSIEFSKLRTNPATDVRYAYMLSGFDKDWNYSGARNIGSYTNVPGGNYIFRVKAMNESGEWGDAELTIPVTILPPFWKTWWFIALAIVAVFSSLYFFYLYRINNLKRIMSMRTKISQDLHDEVGATLTSISFLSEVARKQAAGDESPLNRTLDKIGDYSREMIGEINDIVWAINPVNDKFGKITDRMKNFALPLLSARNIQMEFKAAEGMDDYSLGMEQRKNLYLVFKEAVNNAAKYADCDRLTVHFEKTKNILTLSIADNGKGFDLKKKQDGNGLKNIQLRAREIGAEINIKSIAGQGTEIILKMPVTQIADWEG